MRRETVLALLFALVLLLGTTAPRTRAQEGPPIIPIYTNPADCDPVVGLGCYALPLVAK